MPVEACLHQPTTLGKKVIHCLSRLLMIPVAVFMMLTLTLEVTSVSLSLAMLVNFTATRPTYVQIGFGSHMEEGV